MWNQSSLILFLGFICPATSLAYSIMFTSLQTLATTVAPVESIFPVLAATDVLQNAVSVTVPLYRTILFALLTAGDNQGDTSGRTSIEGDPCPRFWLLSCTIHWFLAAVALGYLLLTDGGLSHARSKAKRTSKSKKQR